MPLVITKGLGSFGDGSLSTLLTTQGYGSPGAATYIACKAFQALSVASFGSYIEIIFNNLPSVSGPSADPTQYVIVPLNGGVPVHATSLVVIANRIRLYTTEHTEGKTYRLTIPVNGLVDQFLNPFDGLFTIDYIGVGIAPTALLARSIDARLIEVTFDEPVLTSDAINAANYNIAPTLTVVNIYQVSPTIYRLVTSKQAIGQLYMVTITGIHDLDGNLI